MSQSDILKLLDENKNKWFSIDEVKEELNKSNKFVGCVWRQVNKLCAYGLVNTKLERLDNCRFGFKRLIKAKT